MGLWRAICGIFSRKNRPVVLDLQIGRIGVDETENYPKALKVVESQPREQKYPYPCEEVDNGDGTVTLQAIFVDCGGTLIVGGKVYKPVLDLVSALSVERKLPVVVWTLGDLQKQQKILLNGGCDLEVFRRRVGEAGDLVAVMVDDISYIAVEKSTGLKPVEFLYVYDLFPELLGLNQE